LMEEYNKLHTTNEEQNSTYCYWWNNTGKKHPNTKKSTLLS
jgi:hypothetical protein